MKYGNTPKACSEGFMHQSTGESRRCSELHLLQKGGLISDLKAHPQPSFRLKVNDVLICDYLADFEYLDDKGAQVVEDFKGIETRDFKLKRKLMKAIHGIDVRIVKKKDLSIG